MKKIFKNPIFTFILGAVLFSGITGVVAYQYQASQVSFTPKDKTWKVDNVKEAIDDLYTKAKPEYTGSTIVTPTTSSQTLSTKDKILTKNITINAIPDTYKNLTTTTTVSASNLLSGVKAYTSDGTLVTGNVSTNCVSGSHTWTQNDTNNGLVLMSEKPKYFAITVYGNGTHSLWFYDETISTTNFYSINLSNSSINSISFSSQTSFSIDNNLKLKWSSGRIGQTLEYMACK